MRNVDDPDSRSSVHGKTPSVVLVHGGWFGPSCWDAVIAELETLGAAAVAVELPFNGFHADVAVARHAIEAAGPHAIVAAHWTSPVREWRRATSRMAIARLLAALGVGTAYQVRQCGFRH
jgi:hypothetical protein